MKNIIGIIFFFVCGIGLGGGILQLSLKGSILVGALCYTIYQALIARDLTFPILLWVFLGAWFVFIWLMS